jgi:ATP diphosphatase
MKEIDELMRIMRTLRDPARGCPWDREQTMRSILPYTLEECYEIADAIERDDMDGIRDELGDLLFHLIFYAQIASEQGLFDFRGVAASTGAKLRNRHPHVFAGGKTGSADELPPSWEIIKHLERRQRNAKATLLDDINPSQPAMSRAHALQKRAATVGFDWDSPGPVLAKIEEEIGELKTAVQSGMDQNLLMDEMGDLLFACVNLARHFDVNPETALRHANDKFERRFRYIEQRLVADHKELSAATLSEMEALWQEAKAREQERRE